MKQNQISALPKLTLENMETIFNVYTDADGMYYYNLLQTISFPSNLPSTFFKNYTVEYQEHGHIFHIKHTVLQIFGG